MAKRKTTKTKKKQLIERTVQEEAQKYLEQYYTIKRNPPKLYSKLEEHTKKKFGMKRADGFLAYKQNATKAYTISMEAKSYKTLPALKPYRVDKLWIRESIWRGFLFTLMTGVLYIAWRWTDAGIIRFLIPLSVWSIAASIHAYFMRNNPRYQEMEVVHQVFQYPANEQWLSFSKDAFEMINEKVRNNLFDICQARGIGVLLVNEDLKVNLINKPKIHYKWFGDFLIYYLYENKIREELAVKLRPEADNNKAKKKRVKKTKK